MHDNIDPNLVEILSILQEECAEVVQAVSKVFRFGAFNVYEPVEKTNRQRLADEMGDVLAMIDLLVQRNFVTKSELEQAKASKLIKLTKWSKIQQPVDEKFDA